MSLLRAEAVADLLQVKPSTVYEWARMNYIPHIRLGLGKKKPCVRFDPAEIRRWIKDRSKEGRPKRVVV